MQRLVAEAFKKAPARSEGMDNAASVRVVLDRNGMPERIEVVGEWRAKLRPEKIGDAVVEAFHAAAHKRAAAWSDALKETGWQDKMRRLKRHLDDAAIAIPSDKLPVAYERPHKEVRRRTLEDVTEGFMRVADKASTSPIPVPNIRKSTGRSVGRNVSVVLDESGLKSCVVDSRWASTRPSTELSKALNEALVAARSSLAGKLKEKPVDLELDDLLRSALDLLSDPSRLIE
jgi:hypothetical protein